MATTTTATKATEGTLSDVSDVPVQYRVIHGHRRAFRMLGTGPALLLLHGIGDSSQTWVPLMRRLARRYIIKANYADAPGIAPSSLAASPRR